MCQGAHIFKAELSLQIYPKKIPLLEFSRKFLEILQRIFGLLLLLIDWEVKDFVINHLYL